ncbi:MAG: hypothetical protein ACQKBT_01145, partial [Puniceicoccales bacterium]
SGEEEPADIYESVPIEVSGGVFRVELVVGERAIAPVVGIEAKPGDELIWWIAATDRSDLATGPNQAESSRSTLRVVTAEEKIAELMDEVRAGVSVVEEVSDEQEKTARILHRLIEKGGGR